MSNLKIKKENLVGQKEGAMTDYYEVIKKLGQGSYGKVYSVKNKQTGEIRACKQISKHLLPDLKLFKNEMNIMSTLTHPNIIKIFEIFEDDRFYYIIIEKCNGGELFEKLTKRIQEGNLYTEKFASKIFQQLMSAIAYCHSKGICHRDLKLENLLYLNEGDEENNPIKVIDFGMGEKFDNKNKMKMKVGSAYYMAPEVLKGKYTEKCDIWSAGVILYILLTGNPPFNGRNDKEIYDSIISGKYTVDKKMSKYAKDLLSKMLCPEEKRLSAVEVLEDKWFKKKEEKKKNENDDIINFDINKFTKFTEINKIRNLALTFIASRINDNEVKDLKSFFVKMDINKDGVITFDELKQGLSKMNVNLELDEVKELFQALDSNNDATIDYTEFLSCSINEKKYLKEERLYEFFHSLDKDHSGKLSLNEIKSAFGNEANSETINQLLKKVDKNGDGEIDYNEFLDLMN